jgi:hypothetical protein
MAGRTLRVRQADREEQYPSPQVIKAALKTEVAMRVEHDLLLYPLGEPTDHPVCAECRAEMTLTTVEARCESRDISVFRCPVCNRSESFIAEGESPLFA